jgi:hypothetical protein
MDRFRKINKVESDVCKIHVIRKIGFTQNVRAKQNDI